jgi:Domain of unknown function (DUF4276)
MVSVSLYVEGGGNTSTGKSFLDERRRATKVEGGGNTSTGKSAFRKGLTQFFLKTELKGKMPKIIACGARSNAYNAFCTALNEKNDNNDIIILLIDSEVTFSSEQSKWGFLKQQPNDKWEKPFNASEEHVYLMVQCMEAWLVADPDALAKYYGNNFRANLLPRCASRDIDKNTLYKTLAAATKNTTKKSYDKGSHPFDLLAEINPEKVFSSCPSAKQLIDHLLTIS